MSITLKEIVIDAENGILGRVASYAAKQALLGKKVVIVNCAQAIVTGKPRTTIREYGGLRRRGGSSLKGPFFPKHPERVMKRTIRGMLPHLQQRGIDALKRVRCYDGLPAEHASAKCMTFPSSTLAKTISLGELSREI